MYGNTIYLINTNYKFPLFALFSVFPLFPYEYEFGFFLKKVPKNKRPQPNSFCLDYFCQLFLKKSQTRIRMEKAEIRKKEQKAEIHFPKM